MHEKFMHFNWLAWGQTAVPFVCVCVACLVVSRVPRRPRTSAFRSGDLSGVCDPRSTAPERFVLQRPTQPMPDAMQPKRCLKILFFHIIIAFASSSIWAAGAAAW